MGYQKTYTRVAFLIVRVLFLGSLLAGVLISPTGSMPKMRPAPETVTAATFFIIPQEVVVNVSDTFFVRVLALHVTDVYCWQIELIFSPIILECLNVSVVNHHVFSDAYTVSEALIDYNNTEFTSIPIQSIKNDEGQVLAGDCLLGQNQSTFSGSGFLCQIAFEAISPGSSNLELSTSSKWGFQTFLLDSQGEETVPIVFSSRVIVRPTQNLSILAASMCIGICFCTSFLKAKRKS